MYTTSLFDSTESEPVSRFGSSVISPRSSDDTVLVLDSVQDSVVGKSISIAAALAAAACMSLGDEETGLGNNPTSSGKLIIAELPLMLSAATSCARAAISGFRYVPSHILDFFLGSRISDTHFPQLRMRTPR
ncbi:hypothetical protein HanPSC8_Chr01g0043061 [Helianthus annuus]|nr:hypothetical protein HanPSC8_Chr01g0043061 [Helianthus annuus]